MKTLIATLVVASLAGCSTYKPPVDHHPVTSRTYALSYDQCWNGIVDWFAENSIPIKTIDKASGLIATEYNLSNRIHGTYDCGTDGYDQTIGKEKLASFNVIVRKVGDSVRVNVTTTFTTTISNVYAKTPPEPLTCTSTGKLESMILDRIR